MCVSCGCGINPDSVVALSETEHVHADGTRHSHAYSHRSLDPGGLRERPHDHSHDHDHPHAHADEGDGGGHPHPPAQGADLSVTGRDSRLIELETHILSKNQLIAERNRGWLAGRGVLALNIVSSPGTGKTTLLERTLSDLKGEIPIAVIEGDQATSNEAQRIRATGARVVQVNTGSGCHLEAEMLERAIRVLEPEPHSVLMIENVGNLVCPALFDLGEEAKVVLFSVTEGEDKPLKYPHIFSAAAVILLSKIDLLPHLRFDVDKARANALSINPRLSVFQLSAQSGEGLEDWYAWIKAGVSAAGRKAT